jgi:large subunit ribosomal protein L10
MNKQEKTQEVETLRAILKETPPIFVLGYRGLTVNQVSALRKKVRAAHSRYKVVKNRLALRVLRESTFKDLAPHFTGPTAIAYAASDPAPLARALEEFTRDHQGLTLKAGLVEGRLVDAQGIRAIALLPSRDVLIARLLGALNAPMVRLVTALRSPARGVVTALDRIARKKEEAAGAASGAPTA